MGPLLLGPGLERMLGPAVLFPDETQVQTGQPTEIWRKESMDPTQLRMLLLHFLGKMGFYWNPLYSPRLGEAGPLAACKGDGRLNPFTVHVPC